MARRVISWLRSEATAGAELVCVCTGSVLAAHAGLLAGRECTTHHEHIDELRRAEPRARVLENRIFVEDGPVVSSAGVTAGLDLALPPAPDTTGPSSTKMRFSSTRARGSARRNSSMCS